MTKSINEFSNNQRVIFFVLLFNKSQFHWINWSRDQLFQTKIGRYVPILKSWRDGMMPAGADIIRLYGNFVPNNILSLFAMLHVVCDWLSAKVIEVLTSFQNHVNTESRQFFPNLFVLQLIIMCRSDLRKSLNELIALSSIEILSVAFAWLLI